MDDEIPPGSAPSQSLKIISGGRQEPSLDSPQDALDRGMVALSRSIRMKTMWPRMERLCPPRSERFWVIGGRPGNFKTQLLWNLALDMADRKQRVLFVSLELTTGELTVQALARFSRIELDRIEAGRRRSPPFTDAEQAALDSAIERVVGTDLFLRLHGVEHGRTMPSVLRSTTRNRFDAIFIDHVAMIGRDAGHRLDELARAVDKLRGLARGEVAAGYRPFVCVASPLNREIDRDAEGDDERMPRMSDFWGSSSIESDADVAMILQKVRQPEESVAPCAVNASVLKNRQGKCPIVLRFEAQGAICLVTERQPHEGTP